MTAYGWSSFPPQSARERLSAYRLWRARCQAYCGGGQKTAVSAKARTFHGELEDLEGELVTLRTVSGRTVGGRIDEVFEDYLMFVSGGVEEAIPINQITNVRVCPRVNHETDAILVD